MIDALKELISLIKDVPEMALWILGGFLFYKLAMAGSIIGSVTVVLKLLINRVHDAYTRPKPVGIKKEVYSLENYFITTDGTYKRFLSLIDDLCTNHKSSKYLHHRHVQWLIDAAHEKAKKEGLPRRVSFEELMEMSDADNPNPGKEGEDK